MITGVKITFTGTLIRRDRVRKPTMSDESRGGATRRDLGTMRDVSHTPPAETSAGGVWERGPDTALGDDVTPASD